MEMVWLGWDGGAARRLQPVQLGGFPDGNEVAVLGSVEDGGEMEDGCRDVVYGSWRMGMSPTVGAVGRWIWGGVGVAAPDGIGRPLDGEGMQRW